MTVHILVVDDHPIFRDGLERLTRQLGPHVEVRTAWDVDTLNERVAAGPAPDLFVLDLIFPGFDGAASVSELRRRFPLSQIVIVSMVDDEEIINQVMQGGANGFISKAASPTSMSSALKRVMNGEVVRVREDTAQADAASKDAVVNLSPRQWEILCLLRDGQTNKEIARALGISHFTVRAHVSSLMRQFNATTRTAVIKQAIQSGVI